MSHCIPYQQQVDHTEIHQYASYPSPQSLARFVHSNEPEKTMNLILLLIVLLFLFGGGGYYAGGPLVGGGLGGLILIILIVMLVTGKRL